MRTTTIVSRVLASCKNYMHIVRWQRLVDLSSVALNGQAPALTQLALVSASQTTLRHWVKAVDRLFGNASFLIGAALPRRAKLLVTPPARWSWIFDRLAA